MWPAVRRRRQVQGGGAGAGEALDAALTMAKLWGLGMECGCAMRSKGAQAATYKQALEILHRILRYARGLERAAAHLPSPADAAVRHSGTARRRGPKQSKNDSGTPCALIFTIHSIHRGPAGLLLQNWLFSEC